MTRAIAIRHIDAFTARPLEGNPAAVVDGDGLDTATMQRIALNQKLSETVFLLPPESADHHARIRIFTPREELPFAGHPTLAAAHVLISEQIVKLPPGEPIVLLTGAGLVPLTVEASDPPTYTMTQRPAEFREAPGSAEEVAAWLGLEPGEVLRTESVSTGLWWHIAQLASLDAVRRARNDSPEMMKRSLSFFALDAEDPMCSIRVRTFAQPSGVPEDPVTGSSNGCIGAFIAKHGLLPFEHGEVEYRAEQGVEMGQPGIVEVHAGIYFGEFRVRVGGQAVTVLRGELLL